MNNYDVLFSASKGRFWISAFNNYQFCGFWFALGVDEIKEDWHSVKSLCMQLQIGWLHLAMGFDLE